MRIAASCVAVVVLALLAAGAGCGSDAKSGADAVADQGRMEEVDVGPETGDLGPDAEDVGPDGAVDAQPPEDAAEVGPLEKGRVSGLVREANGLPVAGATVSLLDAQSMEPVAGPFAVDAFGAFDSGEVAMGKVVLRAQADGYKSADVSGIAAGADVSVTLPAGSGGIAVTLPDAPVLEVTRQGADAALTWTASKDEQFHSFRVMRARTAAVTLLSSNVGILSDPAAGQMGDKNLPAGTEYYRVYVDIETADGHFMTGGNVVAVDVPAADAMPDKQAFVMMKTGKDKDSGMINTAYLVVAPTDISAEIGAGKKITITSPLADGEAKAAMYIGKTMTNYKGNKGYYYGLPATFVGETRKLDEWDTKYALTAKQWAADKRIGTYLFDIEGGQTSFEFTEPMPDSRIENVKLVREGGVLTVTWEMIEDGVPVAGGAGKYGWKYLVKIAYPGVYMTGTDPTYEAEKMWTNFDIFDKELNIGFSRVCEVAANMPGHESSVQVPEGVFAPGDTVHVMVYAISTTESFISPDSGVAGYGKAFMYWLFNYEVMLKVP